MQSVHLIPECYPLTMNPENLYTFLAKHEIEFERHDHPPVYTCEEANALLSHLPGARTKNLFLRDKKGTRHFLVVVPDEKQVDMKMLAQHIESTKLSMGSPDRLKNHLGIEPGSVSLLAVVNDHAGAVEVILDESLRHAKALQCHPLVNTSTLIISSGGINKLLRVTRHEPNIVDIPSIETADEF